MSDAMVAWQEAPLGELADIAIGGTPSRDVESYWASDRTDGFPWVAISDLHGRIIRETKEQITAAGVNNSNVKLVTAGTVLMSFKLSLGRVAFAGRDLFTNEAIAAFKSRGEVAEDFLFYVLPEAVRTTATDVAIKGATLNKESLKALRIPYPCKAVQQRIATILTGIDTAIEKTEALIAKYQQIKAGLMHDLFTRGVLPNGQLRPPREQAPELYQETAIGWIPREWRVKRLDEVAQVARGKFTHRPRNDPAYYGGNYPFIQTGDVSAAEGGFLSIHSQTLSALGTTVSQCFPEGTIAITIAANIADTAILAVPMYFPDSVVGAVVQQGVNVRFVELCIRRAKRRLDAMATQSAQKNINLQDLRPLLIPYPESGEQDRIANLFTAIQSKLDSEVSTREKLRAKKRGLMHDLLTGKVPFKVEEPEVVDG